MLGNWVTKNIILSSAADPGEWTPDKDPFLHTWMRGDDPDVVITPGSPDRYTVIPDRGKTGESFIPSSIGIVVSTLFSTGISPYFEGGRSLISSRNASEYSLLHNNGDCSLYGVSYFPSLLTTNGLISSSSGIRGIRLFIRNNGSFAVIVGNNSETVTIESTTGLVSNNTLVFWCYRKQGNSVQLFLGNTEVANGVINNPYSGNPSNTLTIGVLIGLSSAIASNLPEVVLFSSAHNSMERERVFNYLSRWTVA